MVKIIIMYIRFELCNKVYYFVYSKLKELQETLEVSKATTKVSTVQLTFSDIIIG